MAQLNLAKRKSFSDNNMKRIINILVGLMASQSTIESQCLFPYDETKTYSKNMICLYQNHLYLCKSTTTGTFNPNAWILQDDNFTELDLDTIKSYLNLSQQDLDNLQNLIDDAQITLTKTHSSSKIYMDIQQCLDDSKTFTLKEISKLSGASYKVVASTSEMTSESIIYLLPNATNYDMYIVEADGTATRIGNMDIDLSQYAKIDEIEADFLKKTDADGKYATITTVDGKVDKTNILTANSSSATDEQVYSAKAINNEMVKKTDISTTIDSTSTDDTIPTNKAVYDSLINKVNNTIALNTADEVNSFDREYQSFIIPPTVAEAVGLPKAPDSTWFCINLSHIKGFRYPSQIAFEYAGIERIMYRTAHNGVWHNWRKIPTTSVANVDKTELKNTSTSYPNDTKSYYTVKNGWCQVSLSFKCATAETNLVDVLTLPKPKMLTYAYGLPRNINIDVSKAPVFIFLTEGGVLQMAYGSGDGTEYRCSFSYPVAES